jgi:hypothetical protein
MDEGLVPRRDLQPELVEPLPAEAARWRPILLAPVANFRSPVMDRARPEWLDLRGSTPSLAVPSLSSVAGELRWGALPALAILLVFGWVQIALLAGVLAIAGRLVDRWIGRSGVSFAGGFLPFRTEDAWPHGVREDDDVRWQWSAVGQGNRAPG